MSEQHGLGPRSFISASPTFGSPSASNSILNRRICRVPLRLSLITRFGRARRTREIEDYWEEVDEDDDDFEENERDNDDMKGESEEEEGLLTPVIDLETAETEILNEYESESGVPFVRVSNRSNNDMDLKQSDNAEYFLTEEIADEEDEENEETDQDEEGDEDYDFDIEGVESLTVQPLFNEKSPLLSRSLAEYYEKRISGELTPSELPPGWIDAFAVSVAEPKFKELINLYARVGIQIKVNFGDFQVGRSKTVADRLSLREWSSFKARQIYVGTGMPAIAETTSFEIAGDVGAKSEQAYYTRELNDDEIEKRIQKLQSIADPNRVTKFETWVAYNDGENEIECQGECEVALIFSNPRRATIARSTALDNLYKELTGLLHLNLGHFELASQEKDLELVRKHDLVGGSLLRARILREGKVLTGGILKVSSFLNHMVDAELMDLCGIELAERLRHTMPNKVLTVEATGLIPALSVARRLEIPVVFARKSRPLTISDSYQTMYRSQTKGVMNELIVSTEYLSSTDRVIVIDDFLAGGSTAEALFKLSGMARAKVVGVGVLIEKATDGGRASLAGYDVPVVSLAKIESLEEGRIEIAPEEPFEVIDFDSET